MNRMPLWLKMWISMAGMTVAAFVVVMLLVPGILDRFFTSEIYATIEESQAELAAMSLQEREPRGQRPRPAEDAANQDTRTVRHFLLGPRGVMVVMEDGRLNAGGRTVPPAFMSGISRQAQQQSENLRRYSLTENGEKMFYVIRKASLGGADAHLVSYMWDTYRQDLVKTLTARLAWLMAAAAVASVVPAIWLARYLTKPIVLLDRTVTRIADRQWDEAAAIDRADEIGRLASSVERMRQRLKAQDEAQQTMLQNVSHELKTPVMVIQSYAQSVRDGIFPQGDLDGSLLVIQGEAARLEKRIRDLLYLTRLEYLASQPERRAPFALDRTVRSAVDRLSVSRPELRWDVALEPATVEGDEEQWTTAVENVLDNAMRYAASTIEVTLRREEKGLRLAVFNDGSALEKGAPERLFVPFVKGEGGQYGIGLAVVRRIADVHGVGVRMDNVPGGVRVEWAWPGPQRQSEPR